MNETGDGIARTTPEGWPIINPEYIAPKAAPGPTPAQVVGTTKPAFIGAPVEWAWAASTTPEGWPIVSAEEWQAAHDELQLERVERAREWDLQRQEVRELTAALQEQVSFGGHHFPSFYKAARQLVEALKELERLEEVGK